MSDSNSECCSKPKWYLVTIAVFVVFGFLALVLLGFVGNESAEDRAYAGEFSPETTTQRWANLEEVRGAQAALVDEAKIKAAMEAILKAPAKVEPTNIVVPGSPTFLEQTAATANSEAPTEPSTPPVKEGAEAATKESPAPEAPAPAPAPAPEAPAPEAPAPEAPAPAAPAPAE